MSAASRRFLEIVIGSIVLSCALGLCVDLVTANVAVEYFSVYHPRIISSENPWLLAIIWGVGASWWFGGIGGVIVGAINHRRRDPLEPKQVLRWVAIACVVIWLIMMTILVAVWLIAGTIPEASRRTTFEHDRRLMAVALAHQFEYVLGAVAVLVIAIATWRYRERDVSGLGRLFTRRVKG